MKNSLKLLVGFAASIGFSSVSLSALAQQAPTVTPNPTPSEQSPAQPSDQPSNNQSPTDSPTNFEQPQNPIPGSGSQFQNRTQSEVSVPTAAEPMNMDEMIRQSMSFELFNSLVRVADSRGANLSAKLSGDKNYTVFAPTDAAFAALPPGTIKQLVQPENQDTLVEILSYHIVSGKVAATAMPGTESASSSNNERPVSLQAGAQVLRSDIQASNGVIHAIDRVILPPDVQSSLNLIPNNSGR